jgi:hypothetical protein
MQSPFVVSGTTPGHSIMDELRIKIREARLNPSECVCKIENVFIGHETRTIRRVLLDNHSYQVGWVVDSDLDACMICIRPFSNLLFRFRHHCRACGNLVCGDCSPYKTRIPSIVSEESMSRVCLNCFGLKVTVQDPGEYQKKQEHLAFENIQRKNNLEAYRYHHKDRICPLFSHITNNINYICV